MENSRASDDRDIVRIEDGFAPVEVILKQAGLDAGGGPTFWGSSFYNRVKKCLYLALMTRLLGFEPARTQALVVGILFHAAMAFWYRTRDRSQALRVCQVVQDWTRKQLADAQERGATATWPQELHGFAQAAQNLVIAYIAGYVQAPQGQHITIEAVKVMDPPQEDILFVEKDIYALPPQSDFPVSVRYDVVFRVIDPVDGAVCVVLPDHKTTRNASPEWEEAWWQDDQMMALFYVWQTVMEPLGWPPARAVMVNTIEKPKGRNDAPAFRRLILPIRPDRMEVWKQQMRYHHAQFAKFEAEVEKARAAGLREIDWRTVPQNWGSCFGMRYSICSQLRHCLGLRDMSVYSKVEPPHPTLEQTTWWGQFCKQFNQSLDTEPQKIFGKSWQALTPAEADKCISIAKGALQLFLTGPAPTTPPVTVTPPAGITLLPPGGDVCSDKPHLGNPQPVPVTSVPVPPPVPTVAEQELDDQWLVRFRAVTSEACRLGWDAEQLQTWIEKRFSNELTLGDLTDSELRLVRNELAAMPGQLSLLPQPAPDAVVGDTPPPASTAAQAPAADPPQPEPVNSVTMLQIEKMEELAKRNRGWNYEQVCAWIYSLTGRAITDITAVEADGLLTQLGEPHPPVVISAPAQVAEAWTKDQLEALQKAQTRAGWTPEQVTALAVEMFQRDLAGLNRQQMKQLILQVLDVGASSDIVMLTPPEPLEADFDAIMKTVAELTAHRTDGIAAWMKTAAEPVLREYAARFSGQGDRFHNIRDIDRLRVEVARVMLEDVQAKVAAAQEPATPPPPLTLEYVIAAVKSIAVVKVVKFDARAAVPVADAVSGRWYLVRGCIAMASPQRDEKQRTFILEHGTPLGVGYLKDDVTPLLATPCDVVDGASKNTPPEAQPPQTDENGNVITTQGMEPSLPRKVGEAAKPTGVVPVWFLGHHKRAKKALEFFQSLSSQGDAFGVALCGKTPETEKLKAFTFTGYDTGAPVPVETAAKTVGSAVWDHFGTLVKGL